MDRKEILSSLRSEIDKILPGCEISYWDFSYFVKFNNQLLLQLFINSGDIIINVLKAPDNHLGFGNKLLEAVKRFSSEIHALTVTVGIDASEIRLYIGDVETSHNSFYIPLYKLSILISGMTWYNNKGFLPDMRKNELNQYISRIQGIINKPLIEFREKSLEEPLRNVLRFMHLTDAVTISELFTRIKQLLTDDCPNRHCNIPYRILSDIVFITNAIFDILIDNEYLDLMTCSIIWKVPLETIDGGKRKRRSLKLLKSQYNYRRKL